MSFWRITGDDVKQLFSKHMYTDWPIVKTLIYFLVKVAFRENTLSDWCPTYLRYDKDGGIVTN